MGSSTVQYIIFQLTTNTTVNRPTALLPKFITCLKSNIDTEANGTNTYDDVQTHKKTSDDIQLYKERLS